MNKGLFSIEALAAFMVLLLILISVPINEKPSHEIIIAKHKLSDFLIVSAINDSGMEELSRDAELFFGKGKFGIGFKGEKTGVFEGKIVVSEIKTISRNSLRVFVLIENTSTIKENFS